MIFEIGYKHTNFEPRTLEVRANICEKCAVLYLSDLHFNTYSEGICAKIIDKIAELNPEIILLGGDYVDFNAGLVYFEMLLKYLKTRENVFAIAGNHDYFFGIEKIKILLEKYAIHWIEKKSYSFFYKNINITIDGNLHYFEHFQAKKIKEINKLSILCLHQPIDFQLFAKKYELAFAGHLHGSQIVWWQNDRGLFPGRFFYKWNKLSEINENCAYFISKGLGDTLPVRYNCPKDMILVNIIPN